MALTPENTTVGFIGTGVMGKSMARNIMKAGYSMNIYTRTKEKAQELIDEGAVWHDSVASLAAASKVVFTIVGYPKDVEEVYLGQNGLLANLAAGSYAVDMTTSSPALAVTLAKEGAAKDIHVLDAPVSGGDIGAKGGTLSIMIGGESKDVDTLMPLFECMGKNIVHQGPAGSGQHTKMSNQIVIAGTMMGVCESLAYAIKAGLKTETVLKSIESGAAGSWSLSNLAPRIIKQDYSPGFFVKHFIKDMTIAIESADAMGIDLPGLKLARALYTKLADQGGEDNGTQALFKLYAG